MGFQSTPVFADIDGDSDLDLVVGEYDGNLNYYLNESANDTITFTPKTAAAENPFSSIDVGYTSNPEFADVDGDNDLDLVVGESVGTLKYFLNESTDSTITFTPKTSTNNPFNGFDVGDNSSLAFADIDGDNDLDLVVGEGQGVLNYFLNGSTGNTISFTDQTSTENPFNNIDVVSYSIPTFAGIDGDNDLDLVVGGSGGTLSYFLNESTVGTIAFTEQKSTDNIFNGVNAGTYTAPTFVDIDGDNDFDLVVGESGGTLKYFLNESANDTITFTPKTSTNNPSYG